MGCSFTRWAEKEMNFTFGERPSRERTAFEKQRASVGTKQEAPVLRRHTPGKAGASCEPGGGEAPRVWFCGSQARVTASGREPSIQSPCETGVLAASAQFPYLTGVWSEFRDE